MRIDYLHNYDTLFDTFFYNTFYVTGMEACELENSTTVRWNITVYFPDEKHYGKYVPNVLSDEELLKYGFFEDISQVECDQTAKCVQEEIPAPMTVPGMYTYVL